MASATRRAKRGTLKAGKGRHPRAKSRKQAIAIGLSEARKKKTISKLPKATRTALARQANKVKRRRAH